MSARKRGLGRGLDALLEKVEAQPATVTLDKLVPNRQQPRVQFGEVGLAELADSIRTQGLVQPIVVTQEKGGKHTIVAGERRWRAARKAGLSEVPVIVRQIDDDQQLLEMALVENLQRADLNPLEEADAYRKLQTAFGLSQQNVATRVGKSRTAVSNSLRLLKLPEDIQELLRAGKLTAGQARPLITMSDPDRQLRLAAKAASEGMSARQVEAAASPAEKPKARKRARVDADTAAAAESLTRSLQTRVEIQRKGKGGWVRVGFHSEDELMRLYDLLMAAGGD